MTAGALIGDRERCLAAGMDDYIAKPVAFEDLAAALRTLGAERRVATERPPAPPAPPVAGLDARVLAELRALDTPGSGFFHGVIGLFLATAPARVDALTAAVRRADAAAVQQPGPRPALDLRQRRGEGHARPVRLSRGGRGSFDRRSSSRSCRSSCDEFRFVQTALEAEQRRARPATPRAGS